MTAEAEAAVVDIVTATPWLVRVLEAVRDAGPRGAYVAAGAVRAAVWDRLSDFTREGRPNDVDVVYFDPTATITADAEHRERLTRHSPAHTWEVTNQAVVHAWHARRLGRDVTPYPSLEAAMAEWPETATAVGARLDGDVVHVIAPLGVGDLLSGIVRANPRRIDRAAFAARVREKRWLERWPRLTLVPDD